MMTGQVRYGDFGRKNRGMRSLTGMIIVGVLHIALVYVLINGLGRAAIEVIKGPIEAQVIEEEKPKEDVPPPPPPKLAPPPPPFVPPPEIQIQAPPAATTNAITQVTREPPPPAPPAPPPPKVEETYETKYPRPVSKVQPRYPDRALELGREGEVEIEFTIAIDGSVKDPVVVRSVPEGVFDSAAMNALVHWIYSPQEVNGHKVEVPGRRAIIKFKLSK